MPGKAASSFVKQRECYRGQDYLCCTIVYHLAPVLEMHRPAVLINLHEKGRRLFTLWEENKHIFFPAGGKLSFCELRKTEKSVCVLLYDLHLLGLLFNRVSFRAFLGSFGYRQATPSDALSYLQKRFQQESCPHEVGAFIGIPLADILGFIVNKGKGYLAYGCWKVYHDPCGARAVFSRCEEAKTRFLDFIRRGYPPRDYLLIHASRASREKQVH